MKHASYVLFVLFAVAHYSSVARCQEAATHDPKSLPGMLPSGQLLLPTQWSLKPAGKQLAVGDFPVTITMHPTAPFAALLHAGYGEHEVVIVDLKEFKIVSRASMPETFVGLCFNSNGSQLFASGAEKEVVHQFRFQDGYLSEHRELRVAHVKERHVPAGLSISPMTRLFM